jgi:hypothetical protein
VAIPRQLQERLQLQRHNRRIMLVAGIGNKQSTDEKRGRVAKMKKSAWMKKKQQKEKEQVERSEERRM